MQAFEGESESSQGSSDEEERAASTVAPNATTSSGPSSFASRNEEEGLPLPHRTLGRKIQGRNPRGEGGLDT